LIADNVSHEEQKDVVGVPRGAMFVSAANAVKLIFTIRITAARTQIKAFLIYLLLLNIIFASLKFLCFIYTAASVIMLNCLHWQMDKNFFIGDIER
jgi:hypothetical protein